MIEEKSKKGCNFMTQSAIMERYCEMSGVAAWILRT